ncbi:hypothetical protein PVAG01_04361 [Phlyctema vagabunda]|uniref:Secreted protein n=1 Tax=Phlyctema vagabunda TaxID=108571 RepID=A0ABR4PNY3_9HELO
MLSLRIYILCIYTITFSRVTSAFSNGQIPVLSCVAQPGFSPGKWGGAWYFVGQDWPDEVILPAGPGFCTCAGYSPQWDTGIWLCNDCNSAQAVPALDIVHGLYNMTDTLGECDYVENSAPLSSQIFMKGPSCKTPSNWHIIVGGREDSNGNACTTCNIENRWQSC